MVQIYFKSGKVLIPPNTSSPTTQTEMHRLRIFSLMIESKDKEILIQKINSIKDKEVIDEVLRLVEVDVDESIYQLSEKQRNEINLSKGEVKQGKGIDSNIADSEIDEWLEK